VRYISAMSRSLARSSSRASRTWATPKGRAGAGAVVRLPRDAGKCTAAQCGVAARKEREAAPRPVHARSDRNKAAWMSLVR